MTRRQFSDLCWAATLLLGLALERPIGSNDSMQSNDAKIGLRRHLEGWPAAVVVLLLATSAVLLGVPRAVEPHDLPEPSIDVAALSRTMEQDNARARRAPALELDVDIRAVGREYRSYNSAAHDGDLEALAAARRRIVMASAVALQRDAEQLATLRAYQLHRFLAELQRWRSSGIISDELRELGGDVVPMMQRSGWCRAGTRELLADERVLRTLFKKRWNDITRVSGELFALTINENRARHGFLLRHPLHPALKQADSPARRRARSTKQRLATITRLGTLDPNYPTGLARGVVEYRAGRFGAALRSFQSHIDRNPDGPYTLRAQNYVRAALARAQ